MPLFYYARQSSLATKEGAKLWHLSLKKVGRAVDAQQLAEVIAEKSSLTPGDVNPNQVTALRCQFTPEYTRPAAIGTTRALLQGVEFEKWTGVVTDGKDDAGDGGNSGGGSDGDQGENPLG